MNTQIIADFFDRCAPEWDADMVRKNEVIDRILDCGGVGAGKAVLDVACGTGVLFPDYVARGVQSVVGIDLSPEMVKIASKKFEKYEQIRIICQNVLEYAPPKRFDCIMVYNAFPHFFEPERLIAHLTGLLADGGRLTVAHGMSRANINAHHAGRARQVSVGLMHEDELAEIMTKFLDVSIKISDSNQYIVSGTRSAIQTKEQQR